MDELDIGGDRTDEIDAWNRQDFTYRQDYHLCFAAGYIRRPSARELSRQGANDAELRKYLATLSSKPI